MDFAASWDPCAFLLLPVQCQDWITIVAVTKNTTCSSGISDDMDVMHTMCLICITTYIYIYIHYTYIYIYILCIYIYIYIVHIYIYIECLNIMGIHIHICYIYIVHIMLLTGCLSCLNGATRFPFYSDSCGPTVGKCTLW